MPGPNGPPLLTSTTLAGKIDDIDLAGDSAVSSLSAYEQATPPKANGDVCADLTELKEKLNDLIAAINLTLADLGCEA